MPKATDESFASKLKTGKNLGVVRCFNVVIWHGV